MKFTFEIKGSEKTFTEAELQNILEKYFADHTQLEQDEENKLFEVDPQSINQSLFETERADRKEEKLRWFIECEFTRVRQNPEKYGNKFKVMIPDKTWDQKTVAELRAIAKEYGGYTMDWTEKCLEWAQRIQNGESWEELCDKISNSKFVEMVETQYNGVVRVIGNSACWPTPMFIEYVDDDTLENTVPVICFKA